MITDEDAKNLLFGSKNISNVLVPVAEWYVPSIAWYSDCLEAFEVANGVIPGMPTLETFIGVLKGIQDRQQKVITAFVDEVQRDISGTVALNVELNKKKALHPDIVPFENNKKLTILANEAEVSVLADITIVFEVQVTVIAGLVVRAEKLQQAALSS